MTETNAIQTHEASACCAPVTRREDTREGWTYRPSTDIIEQSAEFTVLAEVPGASGDGATVTLENGVLTIDAKVPQRYASASDARVHLQEYGVGDFHRRFNLGEIIDGINAEAVNAEYANGLLTVHVPKMPATRPKRIQVVPRG